jgi:hypothetical protein
MKKTSKNFQFFCSADIRTTDNGIFAKNKQVKMNEIEEKYCKETETPDRPRPLVSRERSAGIDDRSELIADRVGNGICRLPNDYAIIRFHGR